MCGEVVDVFGVRKKKKKILLSSFDFVRYLFCD